MHFQPERSTPEGIGEDDLGSGLNISLVNIPDTIRVKLIPFFRGIPGLKSGMLGAE